jgi:hypothetical protein
VAHHVLSNGTVVLNDVRNGVRRIEGPHLKGLLSE